MFKTIFSFAGRVLNEYISDDAFTLGASLAYYTLFSIAPLLVVIISVSGFFAGPEAVEGQVYGQLSSLVGKETAAEIQQIVKNAYISGNSFWAILAGLGTLLIGATTLFSALKGSLNKVWGILPKPNNGIIGFIKTRILSLSFVLGLGFLMLVSFALNGMVLAFSDELARKVPGLSAFFVGAFSLVFSFSLTVLVFALLFKYLPDARVLWKDVWVGAVFTALLFALGKYLLGLYFTLGDPTSTYGAAASLISLVLWTYYSSQILFLGAEFTQEWTRFHGRSIEAGDQAVKVVQKEITLENGAKKKRDTAPNMGGAVKDSPQPKTDEPS